MNALGAPYCKLCILRFESQVMRKNSSISVGLLYCVCRAPAADLQHKVRHPPVVPRERPQPAHHLLLQDLLPPLLLTAVHSRRLQRVRALIAASLLEFEYIRELVYCECHADLSTFRTTQFSTNTRTLHDRRRFPNTTCGIRSSSKNISSMKCSIVFTL